MSEQPRCKTCAHWQGAEFDDPGDYAYECRKLMSEHKTAKGAVDVCLERHGYDGYSTVESIDTRKDFGCVLHEPIVPSGEKGREE